MLATRFGMSRSHALLAQRVGFGFSVPTPRAFAHVATSKSGKINYTVSCLEKWRNDLQSKPELISSRGKPCSYTDDEIVDWRLQFDDYSESVITRDNFEKKVAKKYPKLSGAELHDKVEKYWHRFDLDSNGSICFSEFCIVSYCMDVTRLAEQLTQNGIVDVFNKYQNGGVMGEKEVKKLMVDYKFTCPIDADVRKLVGKMGAKDGKVHESGFKAFVETEFARRDMM